MLASLWIAKTGLEAQQANIDTVTNNLANASTPAFKRSRAIFEDLLYINMGQPGAQSSQNTMLPSGYQQGVGARVVGNEKLFIQGDIQQTKDELDIAINGRGFFQIQMPDGTTAYTRDGNFQMDSQGQVVNAHGYLLQPAITLPSQASAIEISSDGVVTYTITSGGTVTVTQAGQLTVADFINPAGLQSLGRNLYAETPSSGAPVVGNPGTAGMGEFAQGFYEMSNVNVAEEMVNMIQAQRAYELNSKAVTVADQMLQKLANL